MKLINRLLLSFAFVVSMMDASKAQTLLPNGIYSLSLSQNGTTQFASNTVGTISSSYGGASISNGTDPNLTAYIFDTGSYTASATATLTYFVEVYSLTSGTLVPVDINGLLTASTSGSTVSSNSSFQINTAVPISLSTPPPASYPNTTSVNLSSLGAVNLISDTIYQLTLNSTVTINTAGFSFGSSSIDPTLTIDPGFSNPGNGYQIIYSQNFGPTAPTPEPRSIWLIGMGLGVLIFGRFLRFPKVCLQA